VQTLKRYLIIQGMMFVFGIVGPIFLAKASGAKSVVNKRAGT
jgi:hypothetical protein